MAGVRGAGCAYYRAVLARIHHEGFGFYAQAVAPGIVKLLEPVRERRGSVLEIGCGSGLLTKLLVDAGHRALSTDASVAMFDLARDYAPGAEALQQLRLPDDPAPSVDAIVAVGHPLSYLDDAAQLDRSLVALARALRPGGVLRSTSAITSGGEACRDQPPQVRFGDDWVLITVTSVPDRATIRREMTMFIRSADGVWRRDDEVHDNILVDTKERLTTLAHNAVSAEVRPAFGDETLPAGWLRSSATESIDARRAPTVVEDAPRAMWVTRRARCE